MGGDGGDRWERFTTADEGYVGVLGVSAL